MGFLLQIYYSNLPKQVGISKHIFKILFQNIEYSSIRAQVKILLYFILNYELQK